MDEEATVPWPSTKEVLRSLEKRDWRRRLVEALKDGLDLEGPAAVHAVLMEATATNKIKPSRGPHAATHLPENVRKAMKLWYRNQNARLKELAAEAQLSIPQIREWRGSRLWAQAAGRRLAAEITMKEKKEEKPFRLIRRK
jgi:hypothetical protein